MITKKIICHYTSYMFPGVVQKSTGCKTTIYSRWTRIDLKSMDFDFALTGAYRRFKIQITMELPMERSNAFVTLPDMLSDNLNETDESLGNERVFSRWAYAEDETQIENTWIAGYQSFQSQYR